MISGRDQRAPAPHLSLGSASLTEIAHKLSNRLAKARVNSSGMCCTIATPALSGGAPRGQL
jgi:uncharacterized metal-binding protein